MPVTEGYRMLYLFSLGSTWVGIVLAFSVVLLSVVVSVLHSHPCRFCLQLRNRKNSTKCENMGTNMKILFKNQQSINSKRNFHSVSK